MSPVTCFFFIKKKSLKNIGQRGERRLWRVCYQQGLPRLFWFTTMFQKTSVQLVFIGSFSYGLQVIKCSMFSPYFHTSHRVNLNIFMNSMFFYINYSRSCFKYCFRHGGIFVLREVITEF